MKISLFPFSIYEQFIIDGENSLKTAFGKVEKKRTN